MSHGPKLLLKGSMKGLFRVLIERLPCFTKGSFDRGADLLYGASATGGACQGRALVKTAAQNGVVPLRMFMRSPDCRSRVIV